MENEGSKYHCKVGTTKVDPLNIGAAAATCDSGCSVKTAESTIYQAYVERYDTSEFKAHDSDIEARRLTLFKADGAPSYEMEIGLQYYPIGVPQGSQIVSAELQFHVTASDTLPLIASIRGEKGFPKAFPGKFWNRNEKYRMHNISRRTLTGPVLWDVKTHLDDVSVYRKRPKTVEEAKTLATTLGYQLGTRGDAADFVNRHSGVKGLYVHVKGHLQGVAFFGPFDQGDNVEEQLSAPAKPSYSEPAYIRPTINDAVPTSTSNLAKIVQELVDQPGWNGRSECGSTHGCRDTTVWPTFSLTRAAGWGTREVQTGLYCEHTGCYGNGRFHSLKVEYCSCSAPPPPVDSCPDFSYVGSSIYTSVVGQVQEKARELDAFEADGSLGSASFTFPERTFGHDWSQASFSAYFHIDVNDPSVTSVFSYFHPASPAYTTGHTCEGTVQLRAAHPQLPTAPAGACRYTFAETFSAGSSVCWRPGQGSFFTITLDFESPDVIEWAWYTDDDVETGKPGPTMWRRGMLSSSATTSTYTTTSATTPASSCGDDNCELCFNAFDCDTHALCTWIPGQALGIVIVTPARCSQFRRARKSVRGSSSSRVEDVGAKPLKAALLQLGKFGSRKKQRRAAPIVLGSKCGQHCVIKHAQSRSRKVSVRSKVFGQLAQRAGEMHLFETGCEEYEIEFDPVPAALKATVVSASLSVRSAAGLSSVASEGPASTQTTPLSGPLRVAIRDGSEDSAQVAWDVPEMSPQDSKRHTVNGLDVLLQAQINRRGWRANVSTPTLRLGRNAQYSGWGSRAFAIFDGTCNQTCADNNEATPPAPRRHASELSVAYCDCSAAADMVTEAIDSLLDALFLLGPIATDTNTSTPNAGGIVGNLDDLSADEVAEVQSAAQEQVDAIVEATTAAAAVIENVEPADAFKLLEGGALDAIAASFGAAIFSLTSSGSGDDSISQLGGVGVDFDSGPGTNAGAGNANATEEAPPSMVESVETFASTIVAQALAFDSTSAPDVIEDPTGLMTITWATPAPKPVTTTLTLQLACNAPNFDADDVVKSMLTGLQDLGVPEGDMAGGNATCVAPPPAGQRRAVPASPEKPRFVVDITLVSEDAAASMFSTVLRNQTLTIVVNGIPVTAQADGAIEVVLDEDAVEGVEKVSVGLKGVSATIPFPENATQKAVIVIYYEASNETNSIFPTDTATELSSGVVVAAKPKLASPVLSISIPDGDDGEAGAMLGNLSFTLGVSTDDTPDAADSDWQCVWWDFDRKQTSDAGLTTLGAWATSGCEKEAVTGGFGNETRVTCSCSHLTHFAVLFSSGAGMAVLSQEYVAALETISYVGGSFGLLGIVLTFVVFGMAWDLVKLPEKIIMNLAGALFMGLLLFMVGTTRRKDVAAQSDLSCAVTAVFLHYFFLAQWSWQLIEGMHLYHKFIRVMGEELNFRWYLVIGWAGPLLFVLPSVLAFREHYGSDDMCFLDTSSNANYMLTVPIGVCLFVNCVVMLYILKNIRKHLDDNHVAKAKAQVKGVIAFGATLGLVYIFGAMNIIWKGNKVFPVIFALGVGIQGALIFYFHVYEKDHFKEVLFERMSGKSGKKSNLQLGSRGSTRRSTSHGGSRHSSSNGSSSHHQSRAEKGKSAHHSGNAASNSMVIMEDAYKPPSSQTSETEFPTATNAHYYPGAGMADSTKMFTQSNVSGTIKRRASDIMKSSVVVVKQRPSFISRMGSDRASKFAQHGNVDL